MTNVSVRKIASKDYKIAHEELIRLVATLKKSNAKYLIDELLTESEQIMLVKRFAAIVMFDHHYSTYRVSKTLSMSLSTAQRLYARFEEGAFDNLIYCIPKKEKNGFLSIIEDLIVAQASPRARARLMKRALR